MKSNIKQEDFEKIFKQHLKIEVYSKTIDSLLSPRSLNKINFKPYYQRNYVWDNAKATYFIESILLGTEIPPLIFFNNNTDIEVIDGRQRFETIIRFKENTFSLNKKGLSSLTQLSKATYDDLVKKDNSIVEIFLDAKIRVIEFALVNEPPLDKYLEDRVKKEIFARYNTGITPLKKSEIDNANYDDDPISTSLKTFLKSNSEFSKLLYETFFIVQEKDIDNPPIDKILQFFRKNIVLPQFPINYYASGSNRTEVTTKLYEHLKDSVENQEDEIKELISDFEAKVRFIADVKFTCEERSLRFNRLALECFLWALYICDSENIKLDYNNTSMVEIATFINENITRYVDKDYHYSKLVSERYATTAEFLNQKFLIPFNIYLSGSTEKRIELKKLKQNEDTKSKLGQLESLRLNKPDPAQNSIEDIIRIMNRRRFLVRPTYQRKEVINPTKASGIIESILLGIKLPPIFIFKRDDGINEVIDGQQRILTILGFIGEQYMDENSKTTVSKNHKFSLRTPRILKEIEGSKYGDLPIELKNKILDFQLYVVEIEQTKNPEFNPVDLFIRLNDRPYPIREHSFEMWNSWADYEIIQKIKELAKKQPSWFFLKQINRSNDRDRMENEELLTALIYLEYHSERDETKRILDVFQKGERINARIAVKNNVSQLLQDVTDDENVKKKFNEAIKSTESFIKKLKTILLDKNKKEDELHGYLKTELDIILKGGKEPRQFRRTMQDFYILQEFISGINYEMIKFHRLEIKKHLIDIFKYIKNIPIEDQSDNKGFTNFQKMLKDFREKYKKNERKLKLNEEQTFNLLIEQENKSGISGAPIFLGDEIELDHTQSLATGGSDSIENLKVTHKDENRSKGAK